MPAQDSVGDVCRLDRRETASGMDAAWLAAAPHQDQEERTRILKAPKSANKMFERAVEFKNYHFVILRVCPPEWNAAECRHWTLQLPKSNSANSKSDLRRAPIGPKNGPRNKQR